MSAAPLYAPISHGELSDKLTILSLKLQRITDEDQRQNVVAEHAALSALVAQHLWADPGLADLTEQLAEVNAALWDVEDALRICETKGDFGEGFIALARSVYRLNDQRSALKRKISRWCGSTILEEKSYASRPSPA